MASIAFREYSPPTAAHPLWLYCLTLYAYSCSWINPAFLYNIRFAIPLAAVFSLWGTWNLSRLARRWDLSPLLVAGVPLVFVMFFGVLYSEAHVLFATTAWLLWAGTGGADELARRAWQVGLIAGLVFLARLDAMFLVAAYGVWYAWRVRQLGPVICFGVGAGLLTAPYVLSNWLFFGSPMPISGWIKSSFPTVFVQGFVPSGLSSSLFGFNVVFGIMPIVLAPVVLFWTRRISARFLHLPWALWAGAASQFAYIALYTRFATFWFWYCVQPVVLLGLTMAIGWRQLHGYLPSPQKTSWTLRSATMLAGLGLFAVFASASIGHHWHECRNPSTYFLDFLGANNMHRTGILVNDLPGVAAFYSDNFIVSADMLTANRNLYEEMVSSPNALQTLLEHCRRQGQPIQYVMYVRMGNIESFAAERGSPLGRVL